VNHAALQQPEAPSRTGAVVLILCPGLSPGADNPGASELAGVLARLQHATGYRSLRERAGGVPVEGRASYHGLVGTFTLRVSPCGEFLRRVQARGEHALGFDGMSACASDWSGPT
jgi:hypothetical protein